MTRDRRRARALLIGVAVFAGLLTVAAGLLWAGRPDTEERQPSTGQPGSVTEPVTSPAAGNAGAMHTVGHDEEGAVDAALTYAVAPQEWLYLNDDQIRTSLEEITAPDDVDRLATEVIAEVSSARSRLVEASGPIWWIVHPLASRVDRFSPAEATVSVWIFSLLSAADVAMPQTEWTTSTFRLEWSDDGWRVAEVTDTVGPTPAVGPDDQPWEPEPLDDALKGFRRLVWG
jgi:hypothetical protein